MARNSLSNEFLVYSTLYCLASSQFFERAWKRGYIIPYYSTELCVNNVQVAVNTCTCTGVFTVITTKDQPSGIYNSYNTGGQGLWAVSKQTSSSDYALGLSLLTTINPWHCAITVTKLGHLAVISDSL